MLTRTKLCSPRGGHNISPSTPPAELDDGRKSGGHPRLSDPRLSESESSPPVSPRTTLRQPSPDGGSSHKRLRVGYDNYVATGESRGPGPMSRPSDSAKPPLPMKHYRPPELPRIPEDVLEQAWRTDPYVSDPQGTNDVIHNFFAHIDSTPVMSFLPEEAFKAWGANSSTQKTPSELMLLYGMLSIGTALSGGSKRVAYQYARVAEHAQKASTVNNLLLAQTRILLGLYYISIGRRCEANEFITAAVATTACLQLNLGIDRSREATLTTYPLNLNKAAYCEARRRTLWSLFNLERLSGLFPDRLMMVCPEDIFQRFPSDAQSFEQQVEVPALNFNPYQLSVATTSATEESLEISAYLIEMVHLWSTEISRIYRKSRRPMLLDVDEPTVQSIVRRLQDWQMALPKHFTFDDTNLETAALAGNLGSFVTMHLLYHHAMIKINRHTGATSQRSLGSRPDQIQQCFEHAICVFDVVKALDRLLRLRQNNVSPPPTMLVIVIAEAVDVLTSTGHLVHLNDIIENMRLIKPMIDATCALWEDECPIRDMIDDRLEMLLRIRSRGAQLASPVEGYRIIFGPDGSRDEKSVCWQIASPMEKMYPKDMDIVYAPLH